MAATTATVLLLLFTFSSAHYSSDQPKNDFFSSDPSLVTLPDSDPKSGAAILLPSERPESEPATFSEIDPAEVKSIDSPSAVIEQSEEKSESESAKTDSLPIITLRPINRHFSRGSFFPIRRGHKCHGRLHHHNSHFHHLRQRFSGQREISFGNDMIVAKDQDRGFDPANSGDGQRPERWARYNHGGHRLSLTNDETIKEEINGMAAHPQIYHQHRRHRHYHHRRQQDDDEEEEEEHRHENGIIRGLMRFLNL